MSDKQEHQLKPLSEQDVDSDPFGQFALWFRDAQSAGLRMPEAAALASASVEAAPAVRMVLVKSFDQRGFVFYSNYAGRKARELDANPRAALLFYWQALGRQVRIEGPVEHTSASESAAYVHSRPRGSQLSALASPQSAVIESRAQLESWVHELDACYGPGELPEPSDWGGFRLSPASLELWQQRDDRLHDRLRYRRGDGDRWVVERLAP